MGAPSTAQFRSSWYGLAPPWLRTGNAERYLYTIGLCSDILLDRMAQAISLRMPGQGDVSQIPYLADDRVLEQGPLEPNASFILRLQTAFAAWKTAGSRRAVLREIQAYLQGMQPGVAANLPLLTIISGNTTWTTWAQLYQGTALGAEPTLTRMPYNWDWDGLNHPWRAWLILFSYSLPTGQSGTSATIGTATGTAWGQGANVSGVWVPTAATPINTPFVPVTGLTGITTANVGNWITIAGCSFAANNGTFQIVGYTSATACVVANPSGVSNDTATSWSIASYPFIAPGLAWGSPGQVFGEGELQPPTQDQGALTGGVWGPSLIAPATSPTVSWGLSCPSTLIDAVRLLLRRWKSAETWYPNIVVAFDGGTGAAGSAFSPNSSAGAGNADGTFGGEGKAVGGVWVPNRQITSNADAWCQGTTSWPGGGAPVS